MLMTRSRVRLWKRVAEGGRRVRIRAGEEFKKLRGQDSGSILYVDGPLIRN